MKPPLGKIQRRLWRYFLIHPNSVVTTNTLFRHVYPRAKTFVGDNHGRCIRRAALAVAQVVGRSPNGSGRSLLWRAK